MVDGLFVLKIFGKYIMGGFFSKPTQPQFTSPVEQTPSTPVEQPEDEFPELQDVNKKNSAKTCKKLKGKAVEINKNLCKGLNQRIENNTEGYIDGDDFKKYEEIYWIKNNKGIGMNNKEINALRNRFSDDEKDTYCPVHDPQLCDGSNNPISDAEINIYSNKLEEKKKRDQVIKKEQQVIKKEQQNEMEERAREYDRERQESANTVKQHPVEKQQVNSLGQYWDEQNQRWLGGGASGNFKKIINPETGRSVSIHSQTGKRIIKNYAKHISRK